MSPQIKNPFFPSVDIYTEKVLEPAKQYKYIAFLIPTVKHNPKLFEILKNHVPVRVVVKRKEIVTTYENEDGEEKVHHEITRTIVTNIYGISDKVLPNPPREILESVVKYSGYDNVDDWILDFCNSIPRHSASKITYLCIHKGYGKTRYTKEDIRVYLITVSVVLISKKRKNIGFDLGVGIHE